MSEPEADWLRREQKALKWLYAQAEAGDDIAKTILAMQEDTSTGHCREMTRAVAAVNEARAAALDDAEQVCRERANTAMDSSSSQALQGREREEANELLFAAEAEGCADAIAKLREETP